MDRFDAVMRAHVPWRDAAHRTALDLVSEFGATESIVDLGCGTGALCAWLLEQLPDSRVTGLERDPVMIAVAQAHLRGRATVREQDLTRSGWGAAGPARFSAAIASSVLHMVDAAGYAAVAGELAAVLRPGGLFVDIDEMAVDPPVPRLAAACAGLRQRTLAARVAGAREDHDAWWAALLTEPELAAAVRQRQERCSTGPSGPPASVAQRTAALLGAGFTEVAVVERRLDVAVLAALR
ncbi:class I SAM-dependent methyltransferase [Modestobacter marinus]|uniref:SAM-dependent methyltransferase n=1 Tax=Modestobacter marinus TaxID=477641 RepID=A0A846LMA2_9ACTN|nr:class I SAM-dependent methyltransferase [Modestobacter marinus]NIH68736.1 SAM-dependent methyltransferase [Modestobacter marinus]